jgi:hypothetical protein
MPWYLVPWRRISHLLRYYDRVAKIVAAIASVVSAILLITPKISITPSINTDPADAFATNFSIKNEGHVPVWYPVLGCKVNSDASSTVKMANVIMENNGPHMPKILWPGSTVTRHCGAQMSGIRMDIKV